MPSPLFALSPLDGRYTDKTEELCAYFSEGALIRYRVHVEVEWLIHLCNHAKLESTRRLTPAEVKFLRNLYEKFTEKSAQQVKDIEKITNHDVKAVEYFIKEQIKDHCHSLKDLSEFIHFACTSEDITNLSYGLILKDAVTQSVLPLLDKVLDAVEDLVKKGAKIPMLAHTHGQPASPTIVGKEMLNVKMRLERQKRFLKSQEFLGKINGAVGNWNAHTSAYPEIDWPTVSDAFIKGLGLTPTRYTTQIEPHDFIAELSHTLMRLNTILIDFDRDLWLYIGKNYFLQKVKEGEVGSSTMPHKVNPIDFENSEGNLGLSNAIFDHLALKLPISRMQRDLTDSTVLRNLGVGFGYLVLGYKSTLKGLSRVSINEPKLREELRSHYEVLAEPIQTVMRRYKIEGAYEKLKELTRGKGLTKPAFESFVKSLKIPAAAKTRLLKLTPETYVGLAEELTMKRK
ncbi:MAG: adenylosuccinate lyase [Candidatus Gracilibacteria bacterium]